VSFLTSVIFFSEVAGCSSSGRALPSPSNKGGVSSPLTDDAEDPVLTQLLMRLWGNSLLLFTVFSPLRLTRCFRSRYHDCDVFGCQDRWMRVFKSRECADEGWRLQGLVGLPYRLAPRIDTLTAASRKTYS
jgi:hypothetical protein